MPGWSKGMPRSNVATAIYTAAAVIAVLLIFSLPMLAQEADPPGRVARLSYLSGDVSMQPGGVDDWTAARLNRPLTSGDRLWTSQDARAELQIGNASLRLNSETSFTLSNLDDNRAQVQVAQGSLNVRVRKLYENETFEVNTPNFTVSLLRAGEYRIDVNNDADVSVMTVRSGSAQVEGGGQSVMVRPREQVTFRDSTRPTYDVASAPGLDGFDEWCDARDQREDRALSAKYTSRDVIGYEDLDDYGSWRVYSDYGRVWVPSTVVAGWAPYRFGHWEWIYPWGWTWIDDAPWGFAPFHYGRWVYAPFGWAWVPGPVYVRPVYAPALVAWIGGPHWGVGISFGGGYGYGWLPLGPREPFIPWYHGSRHYWSRVNVHNTYINNTYITNVYNTYNCRGNCGNQRTVTHIRYANRGVPNGVTVVDRDTLVRSRPVGHNAMRVNSDAIKNAPVVARLDATPSRESALGGRGEGRVNRPPERAFARQVVTKTEAPKPVPFDNQVKLFTGGGKRPELSPRDRGIRPLAPGGPTAGRSDLVEARDRVPKPPSAGRSVEDPRTMRGPEDRGNAGIKREVPRPPERAGRPEPGGNTEVRRVADKTTDRVVPRPPEGFKPERDGVTPQRERDSVKPGQADVGTVPRPNRVDRSNSEARVPRPQVDRPVRRETTQVDRGTRGMAPDRPAGVTRTPQVRQEQRMGRSPDAGGGRAMGGTTHSAPVRSAPEVRQAPSGNHGGGGGKVESAPRGNSSGAGGEVRSHPGRG